MDLPLHLGRKLRPIGHLLSMVTDNSILIIINCQAVNGDKNHLKKWGDLCGKGGTMLERGWIVIDIIFFFYLIFS